MMPENPGGQNSATTPIRVYPRAVYEFARYFNRPPNQLGPDHIRQYQAYLFRERKLQPNTVIQHLGGIRFFYIRTLKQSWSADLTPYPKKVIHLPSILSREEVNSLIEAAPTPFQRTLLMALYATGLRRAELARLKIADIDSARNVSTCRVARAGRIAMSCSARIYWKPCASTGAACGANPRRRHRLFPL